MSSTEKYKPSLKRNLSKEEKKRLLLNVLDRLLDASKNPPTPKK